MAWVRLWVLGLGVMLCACAARQPNAASPAGANGAETATAGAPGSLAERLSARIRQLAPSAQVEQRGPLHLHVTNDSEHDVYLDNLAAYCKTSPDGCDQRLEVFAQMTVQSFNEKLDVAHVRATLKNKQFVDHANQLAQRKGQPQRLLSYPYVDDLYLVLVLDTPIATRLLTDADLKELGLTAEDAPNHALRNLMALSTGFKLKQVAPGLFGLVGNDSYDSARFLLHEQWQKLEPHVGGPLVVAPIGRDIVLFTSSTSKPGLDALRLVLLAEKSEPSAAYPITTRAYRWTPAGWEAFELPAP